MPIAIALIFLRYSGRLPPISFVPLFLSWCFRKFFLSGPTPWVARSTLALVQSLLTTLLLLARIEANMKSNQEKAEANRKAGQDSLARMENQIVSLVSRMMADRKADLEALKETNANQERKKERGNKICPS
jgi:hypothetical protein